MLILKQKLDFTRAEGSLKLSEAIKKRKEVQLYLSQVSEALNLCNQDVWKMEEENDTLIAEMTVALESEQMKASVQEEEQEIWISETASLMKEQPNCQVYTQPLEELGNKLRQSYQQQLTDAAIKMNSIEMQNKFSVPSSVLDQATKSLSCWEIGADGRFSVNWRNADLESSPAVVRNLFMLTHFAFSINNRPQQGRQQQQQPLASPSGESSGVHSASTSSSDDSSPSPPSPPAVAAIALKRRIPSLMQLDCHNPTAAKKPRRFSSSFPTVLPICKRFFFGKSRLIMALFNRYHTSEGEMHIIPTIDSPYSTFIRELGVATALFRHLTGHHFTMGLGNVRKHTFQIYFSTILITLYLYLGCPWSFYCCSFLS